MIRFFLLLLGMHFYLAREPDCVGFVFFKKEEEIPNEK